MVRHLPPDSALRRETTAEWSTRDELAAAGLELAHAHYRAVLAAGGVKKGRLPSPLQVPRPTPWTPEQPTTPGAPRTKGRRHAKTPAEVIAVLSAGFGPMRG